MKKFLFFVSMIATLFVVGCTSDMEPSIDDASTNSPASSQSEVKTIADKAMKDFGFFASSRANAEATVSPWMEGSDTLAVIVNYDDGGYVLVNNSDACPSAILAAAGSGSYIVGVNPMSDDYIYSITRPDSFPQIGGGGTLPITPTDPPISNYLKSHTIEYMNLVPDWHQGYPFNIYCPTIDGQKTPVGCVALSITQVCSYIKYPEQIDNHPLNWDEITASNIIDEYPANVNHLAYFLKKIGYYANMSYTPTASYATTQGALNAWKSLGYKNVRTTKNINDIVNQLKKSPVQVLSYATNAPTGHAWVIEGYKYVYTYYPETIFEEEHATVDTYYHFDWGQGGANNGYYYILQDESYSFDGIVFKDLTVIVDLDHE